MEFFILVCLNRVFERDGVKFVVDDILYGFIKGVIVDFIEELI